MGLFDNEENLDHMTVTLTLDDDSEVECAILAVFTVGEQQYIALLPQEDQDSQVFLYRFNEVEGLEPELINIDDDDEFDAAADAFDEIMDNMEFDEIMDENEEV